MSLKELGSWLSALAEPVGVGRGLPDAALAAGALGRLIKLADYHGVLPAVLDNLRRLVEARGAAGLLAARKGSPRAEEALARAFGTAEDMLRRRAGVSLLIRGQVEEILQVLEARSVPAVVLKGSEFADRLYPRPDLRPFTDADLLVPRRAMTEAQAVMAELGYLPKPARMKYNSGYGQRGFVRRCRPGGAVEVHWNLVNSPSLRRGISVVYEDMQLTDVAAGGGRPAPSAASLLLIAAVHAAAGHCFDRLQPLCDVCQAARGAAGQIDIDWLSAAARRTGATLALRASLDLAARMFAEPACKRLERLAAPDGGLRLWRLLVTPPVVLRAHAWRDSFRRQWFRALLKRSG